MRRSIQPREPSPELQAKIVNARTAIASQTPRFIKCPYCQRNAIVVFEDTRGHVQTKCKACGRETVFDVVNMRRIYHLKSKVR